jgi:peptidyl-tRNA hydrolase, PTH1 family
LYLVAGLGNPGLQYERSRHNLGYRAADALAKLWKMPFKSEKMKGYFAQGNIYGDKAAIIKPTTFMNNSGYCLAEATRKLKVADLSQLIVIYDDMDLPVGKIRIRLKGGPGTHNGMKSIVFELGSEDFIRVRIGIGTPPEGVDTVDYVLGHADGEEKTLLDEAVAKAAEAVDCIVREGAEKAMQKFNKG